MKKNFNILPSWLRLNRFYRAKLEGSSEDIASKEFIECHPYDANLISSARRGSELAMPNRAVRHTLMLDLDTKHFYHPSSNPDHAHLYFDTHLSLEDIKEIIDVLNKHGIIQTGIKNSLYERGYLTMRLPGQSKYDSTQNMSFKELEQFGGLNVKD